jgi:hypothetical protein
LATQDRLVRSQLPDGARIVKELGDGLLLWFPDARSALVTLLALQDSFRVEEAASGLPLWVRIGVHWASQRQRGKDLIGHDVNVTFPGCRRGRPDRGRRDRSVAGPG